MIESAIDLFNNRQDSKNSILLKKIAQNSHFEFLGKLHALKFLSILEVSLAVKFGDGSEEVAAFLCHLFLATKEGHLCIKIENNEIFPSPEEVWKSEDGDLPLSLSDSNLLKSLILKGALNASEAIVSDRSENLNNKTSCPVIKSGHFYYFHKSWSLQSFFLRSLSDLLDKQTPAITINLNDAYAKLDNLELENKLLKEQKCAIKNGLASTFTIITGGPGTGKTYTAGMLIKILFQEAPDLKICLCAPTGKAAANLEASIARALSSDPNFKGVSGQTIHQLLKINSHKINDERLVISSDVIIVDECSMIDASLLGRLLWSIKPGARLIMLGDKNQLPSVEAGSLFADMTENLKSYGNVVELKKSMRSESKEIIRFLDGIKAQDLSCLNFLDGAFEGRKSEVSFRSIENLSPKDFQKDIVKHSLPLFKKILSPSEHLFNSLILDEDIQNNIDIKMLLSRLNQFRILTPLRKGSFGSEAINDAIFSALHKKNESLEIVPIMIVKNDYRVSLFNGEVGVLLKYKQSGHLVMRAIFPSRSYDEPLRDIPAQFLPQYELAFCLSIHKSQGSEFDHVVLILPEGSEDFGREGFYTGASRAKKFLEVWSYSKVMEGTIKRTSARLSGISFLLDIPLKKRDNFRKN